MRGENVLQFECTFPAEMGMKTVWVFQERLKNTIFSWKAYAPK